MEFVKGEDLFNPQTIDELIIPHLKAKERTEGD
jgi:hypothetical protein